MDIARFAYFGAYGDAEAWRTFGADVHGLQPDTIGEKLIFRMDEKVWRIAIEPGADRGCAYLGLETDAVNFENIVKQLRDADVDVVVDPALARERLVRQLARFTGPGDLPMELVVGLADAATPFASPLGTCFVTGKGGIGHFGISVEDPDAAAAFYRDLLGFRLTDTIINEPIPGQDKTWDTYFYRSGVRHHTVAILNVPSQIGLNHVFIESDKMTSVGRAWDKVEAGAARVIMTLGQHLNDPAISYYCVCPSRFGFEYGWDATMIEDDSDWQPKLWNNGFTWGHKLQSRKPKPAA